MRRTKIICTIGPASSPEDKIKGLISRGMNVARLNFSHGTREEHVHSISTLRRCAQELGAPLAILQDLQGPKMRIGSLKGGQRVLLDPGAELTITTRPVVGNSRTLSTNYENLPRDVKAGDCIFLADGLIELEVLSVNDPDVRCRVVHGGILAEHQGINLPHVSPSTPALTEKDREDLKLGLEHRVDYVALSFVRGADDIREVKGLISDLGVDAPVIAKLETQEALENLAEILSVVDGVMIARGDLGVELSLEKVPMWQKRIIELANMNHILVITATQMMESMIQSPHPTRAEASDVANAVLDGTDAVMLSGETAVGAYPLEAVEIMGRIVIEAESVASHSGHPSQSAVVEEFAHSLSYAAQQIVELNPSVTAIAVLTQTGLSARMVSKDRPKVPIFAFTPDPVVYNRLALMWGVVPQMCGYMEDIEEIIAEVDRILREEGHVRAGQTVVFVGGLPLNVRGTTNFLRLHRLGAPSQR
ncbi:MAG: pyruvate kinase [Dehalococcoidia bacterium]